MKRLLAAMLVLFVCAAPAAQAGDVRLLRTLYADRGQTVVSPVSLNLALAMAAEGAKGETRAQLLAAAGLTEEGLADFVQKALALQASGVSMASAAFVKAGLNVLPGYDALLKDRYQAERFALGDDVNAEVNAWVKEKTGGLIDSLLDQPVVRTIAGQHGRTPAQTLLRWGVQRHTVVIPKSSSADHLRENLNIFDFELSSEEMDQISALDQQRRFNDPGVFCEQEFHTFFPIYE